MGVGENRMVANFEFRSSQIASDVGHFAVLEGGDLFCSAAVNGKGLVWLVTPFLEEEPEYGPGKPLRR